MAKHVLGSPEQSSRYLGPNGKGMYTAHCSCGWQSGYFVAPGDARRSSHNHASEHAKNENNRR